MREKLKQYTSSARMNMDELVELAAYGRTLSGEYDALGLDAPDWIDDQLKAVRREIKVRNLENIENKLTELKARKDSLKTPQERKRDINSEIEKLEKLRDSVAV